MLYQGVYRLKVEYPLGQTFLTDKQVKKIELASLPKIIVKCGYNINMALDVRGGPKELGGVGFYAFLNTIGATRGQHFLKNWRIPNEDIGKVLRISMAWTQYSAGVPYPILLKTKKRSIICEKQNSTRNMKVSTRKPQSGSSRHKIITTSKTRECCIDYAPSEHTNQPQSECQPKRKDQLCTDVFRSKLCQ